MKGPTMTSDPGYEPIFSSMDGVPYVFPTLAEWESEYYYGPDSKPISQAKWSHLFGDWAPGGARRIGLTKIAGCSVSTVWLGLNNAWQPGQVLIFETMAFNRRSRDENRPWSPEEWTFRYRYKWQAKLGHEAVVNRLRSRGWAGLHHWMPPHAIDMPYGYEMPEPEERAKK